MRRSFSIALISLLLASTAFAQGKSIAPDVNAWRDQTVEYLAALVKIDTSNPPGNEINAARYIQGVLNKEGIASEIFEAAPGRASLVARLKGNRKKKPILLMGHIDVVGVERDK